MTDSSDLVKHYIQPKPHSNPNIPQGVNSLPLHPVTLWPVGTIPSVLVFPGELDLERLKEAIQATAGLWPNICGRYMRVARAGVEGESDFALKRTCSPIPLCTQTLERDTAYPTTNVIQPDLAPFLTPLNPSYFKTESDASLVAFRLTSLLPSRSSVLGINWAHGLGDAAACNRFIHHLSHFYANGPEVPLPAEEIPSFFPHIKLENYPPSDEAIKRHDVILNKTWELADAYKAYMDAAEQSEMLVFRLSRKELKGMRRECPVLEGERLSDQDILSGWWLGVLERAGNERFHKLIYTINYRNMFPDHPNFPPNLPTLSANVAQIRYIPLEHASSLNPPLQTVKVARAIRAELAKIRNDPDLALEWLSVAAHRLETTAVAKKGQFFIPPEGEAIVNSNLRYDWTPSFGFEEGSTAYHTSFSAWRFLRVFQANPPPTRKNGESDVELTFNVRKDDGVTKKKVEEIIESDRRRWASL